jgi:hypothetical protein
MRKSELYPVKKREEGDDEAQNVGRHACSFLIAFWTKCSLVDFRAEIFRHWLQRPFELALGPLY